MLDGMSVTTSSDRKDLQCRKVLYQHSVTTSSSSHFQSFSFHKHKKTSWEIAHIDDDEMKDVIRMLELRDNKYLKRKKKKIN